MTATVVHLGPQAAVVKALERMLAEARGGTLIGFIAVSFERDGTIDTEWSGAMTILEGVGGLELLKSEFIGCSVGHPVTEDGA